LGCPVGRLALEVANDCPGVRRQIVQTFETLCGTIEALLRSDRLPPKTEPATRALHVLATMEGGITLARACRHLDPFDQGVFLPLETVQQIFALLV
jgi:hypothetical protein